MLLLVTAILLLALAALLLLRLRSCRNVASTRKVVLHVPIDRAWDQVRDFPALFAAHGRGRPWLRIDASALEHGDGRSPASVWRQSGTCAGRPYSARIEILEFDPPNVLAVRLAGDTLGSEKGLSDHRAEIHLRADGERSTKITFRLSARIRSLPLLLARLSAPARVDARLLGVSLRSLKAAVDGGSRLADGALPEAESARAPRSGRPRRPSLGAQPHS